VFNCVFIHFIILFQWDLTVDSNVALINVLKYVFASDLDMTDWCSSLNLLTWQSLSRKLHFILFKTEIPFSIHASHPCKQRASDQPVHRLVWVLKYGWKLSFLTLIMCINQGCPGALKLQWVTLANRINLFHTYCKHIPAHTDTHRGKEREGGENLLLGQ